jgi:hypothetical protein
MSLTILASICDKGKEETYTFLLDESIKMAPNERMAIKIIHISYSERFESFKRKACMEVWNTGPGRKT